MTTLTRKQYKSPFGYTWKECMKSIVDKEAELFYKNSPTELPTFDIKVEKLEIKAGVKNFARCLLP